MTTAVRPNRRTLPGSDVAKKKRQTDQGGSPITYQMNIRVPDDLRARIESTAAVLGLDATNFVRMVLNENLAQYEQRAEQIREARRKD